MNQDDLKNYLGDLIKLWREKHNQATNDWDKHTAACYIDAYQNVHVAVFGEVYIDDKKEN
jgi:hypothetical protein